MKKTLFFIAILFFTHQFVHAQKFVGSVIFGGNTTQIEGDELKGFRKFGFNAGASVSLALNKKETWFTTVELIYTQKGSHRKALVDSMRYFNTENIDKSVPYNEKVKYHVSLDYVEVPLLVHYEDHRANWGIGLGFSWGRLVRVKELENGYTLLTDLNSKTYKRDDWSAIVDVKFSIYKNLKFNIRFQHSIVPIREREFVYAQTGEVEVRKQLNQVLTFRIIYSINEKYRLNTKFDKEGNRKGAKWVRAVDY